MTQQPALFDRKLPTTQAEWDRHIRQLTTLQMLVLQLTNAEAGWGSSANGAIIANFPGSGATLTQCGEAISQLIAQLQEVGILAT